MLGHLSALWSVIAHFCLVINYTLLAGSFIKYAVNSRMQQLVVIKELFSLV